ncbi:MAG: polysaccharide lyase [Cognatishimia sp.]|nr:polysaccharide lyase [Cognatishimia sp.]
MIRLSQMILAAAIVGATATAGSAQDTTSIARHTQIESLSFKAPYRHAVVRGFARRGDHSQRFEIRHGDCGQSRGYSDCENDRGRVEQVERPKASFSRRGSGTWYGYSIFVPADFVSLDPGSTSLSQVKITGHSFPLWKITLTNRPFVLFGDGSTCRIGSLASWTGRWNDITVYSHTGTSSDGPFFLLYKDGRLICSMNTPILPREAYGERVEPYFKYGIYSSFVSRYLRPRATGNVNAQESSTTYSNGRSSRNTVAFPFRYDWGVELPTHVVFYDEMLVGNRREDVDVRMREAAGLPPVD